MGDDNRTTRFLDRVSSGFARLAESRLGSRSAIAVACLVACFPAIDNGFISDDYVHLEWAELLLTDPVYLFGTPPIGFRPTSFIAYLGLKKVFTYASPFYYLFSIGVHFITCLLVVALARFVTEDDRIAFWSGMLFAVIYQAQEAVFYIAAMNESLMVLFGVSSILLYLRRRYALCVLTYSLALLSKESAVVIPLLALLVEYGILRMRPFHPVRLLVFAGPAAVRLGFFLYYRAENYYVTEGIHALTPALFGVLLLSLFKLTFPWLPLLLIAPLSRLALGRSPGGEPLVSTGQSSGLRFREWLGWAAWPVIALLPYSTLTYQSHVTSRHFYLAAVGWVILVAVLAFVLSPRKLRIGVLAAFLLVNPAYTWIKKDRQYEIRAASTTQLLEIMRTSEPSVIVITGFPGNPWNGKLTTRLVPGWGPELLVIDEVDQGRTGMRLHWDGQNYRRLE